MTGKFFENAADGNLGLALEPDNDDERLLLKLFERQLLANNSQAMCWAGSRCSLTESEAARGMPYLARLNLAIQKVTP